MLGLLKIQGEIRPLTYAVLAPTLLFVPHLAVLLVFTATGHPLMTDRTWGVLSSTDEFWLLPLRRLAQLPGLPPWGAALAFAFTLVLSWQLVVLSIRRAAWSRIGYGLAALAAVPILQVGAVALLLFLSRRSNDTAVASGAGSRLSYLLRATPTAAAILVVVLFIPFNRAESLSIIPMVVLLLLGAVQIGVVILAMADPVEAQEECEPHRGINVAHVVQGTFAGVAMIVAAVFISAVTLGAYGWGLFVMTPFLAGLTTAYLANRRVALEAGQSAALVQAAGALGCLALLMFALEGLICILLVAPLSALAAAFGGALGRSAALAGNGRNTPLMSVALLPAVFVLEAAMPPAVPIALTETIDISAPPAAVWRALTSEAPIASAPGLVGRAGLAYPIRGRLLGQGVGATRIGEFSTGLARERVTQWMPGHQLAFIVLTQPPAMAEWSPYRRVHAPHVSGYFETAKTSFLLEPLPGGGTRLAVSGSHMLRIDPVLYWEPIARWAIHANATRVLRDIKAKAEMPRS